MPDITTTSHGTHRADAAVASFHRLAAKLEPKAAALITLEAWIYAQDDDHTTACVARAVLAACHTEVERRADQLAADTTRIRAMRAASVTA